MKVFEREAGRLLRDIGVPQHLSGCGYLVEAVVLAAEEPAILRNITGGLYPAVARRHHTTPACTERAMRRAIESAWSHSDPDVLALYFGNSVNPIRGKPANSQFIACLSRALRQEVVS